MRVLVTGATGFIGCHTVAALLAAGHEIRALVRDPSKLAGVLTPLGIDGVDTAVGSILDRHSLRAAMLGCDAVVHAAGMFSDDSRLSDAMHATNVVGTETVLDEAVRAALDPIVHVSSMVVVFPPQGERLSAEDPVREHRLAYPRSKSAAERTVRRFQETGAPVVS